MPSSSSTRLRAELQAAGENLNTWGAPKLNAVVQRLEEAICGRYGVALSAPATLTSSNYVADQARMAFLDFTSGTGGTVTVPAVEKIYVVRNGTSGAVIITTGSGTTATIVAGDIAHIACDGTNCYPVRAYDFGSNKLTNLGTPTLSTDAVTKAYADGLAFSATLPNQAGASGKYLTTDGSTASWGALGTAAAQNTGTSGATLPFLNGANTWASAQTFTAAPVFTDQSGSRTALGLGSSATVNTGTAGATVPLLNGANTWSGLQTLSVGANLTPATTPATNAVGYLGLPQNVQAASYGLVMTDAGKSIYHTNATPHTITIPANGSVAFPIGTVIEILAGSGSGALTVAITTDTLRWVPTNSTGSRTVTAPGKLVIEKVTATEWWAFGMNVT